MQSTSKWNMIKWRYKWGGEGFNFYQDQDFDSNTPAFSGREGLFARCLGLCAHSRGLLRSRIFDVEFQLVIFLTFTFLQSSFLIVVYWSSVLDKDPYGLKVLAWNKFKSKRSLCLQFRLFIIIIMRYKCGESRSRSGGGSDWYEKTKYSHGSLPWYPCFLLASNMGHPPPSHLWYKCLCFWKVRFF